jgi:hypothetical protein
MKTTLTFLFGLITSVALVSAAAAQGSVDLTTVEKLMDSARTVQAQIFSPRAFEDCSRQLPGQDARAD